MVIPFFNNINNAVQYTVLNRIIEKASDCMISPSAIPSCMGRVAITAAPNPFGIMMDMTALSSTGVLL